MKLNIVESKVNLEIQGISNFEELEKLAKESLRLAQKARDEAEKKAKEAVKESVRIDEEMRKRLQELKSE